MIKCILANATSLDVLSRYLKEKGDTQEMFQAKVVISGSEVLGEMARNNLKEVLGCSVVSRYSNQENGILAQETLGLDYFIINYASYHIEFLKIDQDKKAAYGELSRVVITDLYNFATPIIRYDIGDLAIVRKHDSYGTVIKVIEGRRRDFIYNTAGSMLSPSTVTNRMWKYEKINQYQLIQKTEKSYQLKLNGFIGVYDEKELLSTFKSFLGEDANITLEHVQGIPSLSSGKFRSIVCEYIKDDATEEDKQPF